MYVVSVREEMMNGGGVVYVDGKSMQDIVNITAPTTGIMLISVTSVRMMIGKCGRYAIAVLKERIDTVRTSVPVIGKMLISVKRV